MTATRTGETAIAGIGQTEFSKESGRSELQLAAEASLAAITDAGLTPADVDGMVTFVLDQNDELALLRNLGIPELQWMSRTPGGGGAACAVVQHAAAAITAGEASTCSCTGRSTSGPGGDSANPTPRSRRGADRRRSTGTCPTGSYAGAGVQPRLPALHGASTASPTRTSAARSVVDRKHAANNPNAWFYERPITLDDHQSSRWIVEPILRLLDCCQESDGGVAFVVTSAERARDLPRSRCAGRRGGAGARRATAASCTRTSTPTSPTSPRRRALAARLWEASGLTPSDIDVAQIYEAVHAHRVPELESFGFCGRGEAKDFVADGSIELDGLTARRTPKGGLIGEAYIHGMNN